MKAYRKVLCCVLIVGVHSLPVCYAADSKSSGEEPQSTAEKHQGAGEDMKGGFHELGDGFKEGAAETGHAFKGFGKEVEEGFKEGGKEFKDSYKE